MKVLIEFQWFSALVVLSFALEASAFRSSDSTQDKAQRMDGASSGKASNFLIKVLHYCPNAIIKSTLLTSFYLVPRKRVFVSTFKSAQ